MSLNLDAICHVEAGKIVGYVVKPRQGFTQIAEDINNPARQRDYGYSLGKRKIWWYEIANHPKNKKYTKGAAKEKM